MRLLFEFAAVDSAIAHVKSLNEPYDVYGAVEIGHTERVMQWVKKMHEHRKGVALIFARTDTAWFHDYIAKSDAILFLKGRIAFVDGLGVTGGSGAGAGSMLVAWGDVAVSALMEMSDLGLVICP